MNLPSTVQKVFLTGATGMVGSRIAQDLLLANPATKLGCLVLAKDTIEASRLLEKAAKKFHTIYNRDQMMALPGDITAEKSLGMEENQYEEWMNSSDAVIHCAADIHLTRSQTLTNVVGVQNVVEFAKQGQTRSSLHFMSSAAACLCGTGPVPEKELLNPNNVLPGGYGKAKYDAEKHIFEETKRQGLYSFIYRAPFILPRSCSQDKSVPDFFFKLTMLTGVLPRCVSYFPLFPLAGVSEALVNCTLYGEQYTERGTARPLHLVDTSNPSWEDQVAMLRSAAPDIYGHMPEVDFAEFRERVECMVERDPSLWHLGNTKVLSLLEPVWTTPFPRMETGCTKEFLSACGVGLDSHQVSKDDLAASVKRARESLLQQEGNEIKSTFSNAMNDGPEVINAVA